MDGRRGLPLVYLTVLGGVAAQQMLSPVLPPLARELGLGEFQLGVVITFAAAAVVVSSPLWGRVIGRRGHKPILLIALLTGAAGLLGLAAVAHAGLAGAIAAPLVVFGLLMLARGAVFGVSLGALLVAAQAYVVGATSGERERVRGISMIGAAQGLALVVGPALGGLLAGAGLLTALYATPVLLLIVAGLVLVLLPAGDVKRETEKPPRLSPLDRRLWPFLLTGFTMYLTLAFVQITIGFLIQDRLGLSAEDTARNTGWVLLAAGVPFLLCQAVLVPRLGWSPIRLMRTGIPLALVGFGLIAPADSLVWMILAMALAAAGVGLATPGFTSAPTLLVDKREQAGVAGLLAANTALTFVIGPTLGSALYELSPGLPYLAGAGLLTAVLVFLFIHPTVRAGR